MSFDVFVQYFSSGQSEMIPLDDIREIFAPYAKEESESILQIVYDGQNSTALYLYKTTKDRKTEGFCINRPCADERLWKSVYDCMALGHCIVMWPGLEGVITDKMDTAKHIPQEIIEKTGRLIVVGDYKDIIKHLNKS